MSADDDKPNYYELLCIHPNASKDDIKKAYRKQALLFHPDKMKPHMKEEASAHFQLISEAYEVLSDDGKRALYDRYGHEGVKVGGDPNPPPPPPSFDPHNLHGFQDPFFSSFGVRSQPSFQDPFAAHHEHMRHFNRMFGFPHQASMFPDPFQSAFHNPFGNVHHHHQQQQHAARPPTLFSTSPFAGVWSGMGTMNSPFVDMTNGAGGGGGGFTSTTTSSSMGGGGGVRTSTKTTIVNGKRTTVTEVTDAQGVTTRTVDKSDGTREVFVNGVPTAIEGAPSASSSSSSSSRQPTLENNRQHPITIQDDEDPRFGRPSSDPIVLDADDDDEMYENLSRDRTRHRTSYQQQRPQTGSGPTPTPAPAPAPAPTPTHNQGHWDDPNLYHPRMGRGQTLGGSTTSRHGGN
ncbi:MAG: hypothetical protein J3Q66DRAFT_444814 [Benniella sp.]|nr:MAG: hypothetical protein J3Q66DRAFT_444814 [Benniella sp.]